MSKTLKDELKKRREFDTDQQAVVVGMLRTYDAFQYRLAQFFRDYGLTQPQYNVLRILRGAGTPLPCLEIADRLITMVPAITSLIDKLEKRGLVARERCTKDRRVWYVSLTDAGASLLAEMDRPMLERHKTLCAGLTNGECKELVALLDKARAPHANTAKSPADAP